VKLSLSEYSLCYFLEYLEVGHEICVNVGIFTKPAVKYHINFSSCELGLSMLM